MLNYLVHYLLSAAQMAVTIWFAHMFFSMRHKIIIRLVIVIGLLPMIFPCINEIGNMWLNLISSLLISALGIYAVVSSNLQQSFLLSVVVAAANMLCELAVLLLSSLVLDMSTEAIVENNFYNALYTAISSLLFLFATGMFQIIVEHKRKTQNAVRFRTSGRVLLLPLISIILGYYVMYISRFLQSVTFTYFGLAIFILLIFTDIVMLFGQEQDLRRYELQKELETMQLQEEYNMEIITQLQHILGKLSSQAHDFKYHLMVIDEMLHTIHTKSDAQDTERYVNSLMADLDGVVDQQFLEIQNRALRVILSKVSFECQQSDFEFQANIHYSDFGFMEFKDICSLFANTLDNAVHACRHVQDDDTSIRPVISVNIHRQNSNILIKITNSNVTPVKQKGRRFLSSKSDGSRVGIGTMNMRKCIERYHGSMETAQTGNVFALTISLPIPPEPQ